MLFEDKGPTAGFQPPAGSVTAPGTGNAGSAQPPSGPQHRAAPPAPPARGLLPLCTNLAAPQSSHSLPVRGCHSSQRGLCCTPSTARPHPGTGQHPQVPPPPSCWPSAPRAFRALSSKTKQNKVSPLPHPATRSGTFPCVYFCSHPGAVSEQNPLPSPSCRHQPWLSRGCLRDGRARVGADQVSQ